MCMCKAYPQVPTCSCNFFMIGPRTLCPTWWPHQGERAAALSTPAQQQATQAALHGAKQGAQHDQDGMQLF
jgi:hypothetical protein